MFCKGFKLKNEKFAEILNSGENSTILHSIQWTTWGLILMSPRTFLVVILLNVWNLTDSSNRFKLNKQVIKLDSHKNNSCFYLLGELRHERIKFS